MINNENTLPFRLASADERNLGCHPAEAVHVVSAQHPRPRREHAARYRSGDGGQD